LLCTIYILVALYVLHIIMAVMMIYVGNKYKEKECEQPLAEWLFVCGNAPF